MKEKADTNMYKGLASSFLPEGVLNYFEVIDYAEEPNPKDNLYRKILHLYLDELDNRPDDMHDAKPNGFTEEHLILDFPASDRKTTLHVRRRRGTKPDDHNYIVPLDSISSEKTQYLKEFAFFFRQRMDNEPVTAKSLAQTYMIDSGTFEKNYKDVLSGYSNWTQREHASEWMLLPENMGSHLGIDETSFCHEVYTILHNKDGHGKKRSIIAMVKGTKPSDVTKVLMSLPEDTRLNVMDITMDLPNSMAAISRAAFPNATIICVCFHVIQRSCEGIEEIRLRQMHAARDESDKRHHHGIRG